MRKQSDHATIDWGKYGIKDAFELSVFYQTRTGKELTEKQIADFILRERQTLDLIQEGIKIQDKRQALLASLILDSVQKEDEFRQLQKQPVTLQSPIQRAEKVPPKLNLQDKIIPSASDPHQQLAIIHKEIIHTAEKHVKYDTALKEAEDKIVEFEKKKDTVDLSQEISSLETMQDDLMEKMMNWDGVNEDEIRKLQEEYNTNEVKLGSYRTLKDVKEGKIVMYDEEGNPLIENFSSAKYLVPKDKQLIKVGEQTYLFDSSQTFKDLTETQKEKAAKKFIDATTKDTKDNISKVADFLELHKSFEMGQLNDKRSSLLTILQSKVQSPIESSTSSPPKTTTPASSSSNTTTHTWKDKLSSMIELTGLKSKKTQGDQTQNDSVKFKKWN